MLAGMTLLMSVPVFFFAVLAKQAKTQPTMHLGKGK